VKKLIALTALIIAFGGTAAALTVPATVVHGTPGSVHQLASGPVPAADVGCDANVTIASANNESLHPNSDLLVQTGGQTLTLPDVEKTTAPDTITGPMTLGSSVVVSVRLGADGVYSGAAATVTWRCLPPPTTTPPVSVGGIVVTRPSVSVAPTAVTASPAFAG
jgi:hypothetical protein